MNLHPSVVCYCIIITGSAEEDSEVSTDGKTVSSEQMSKIEQNRKKAQALRASKRPLSHEPGTYGAFVVSFEF